MSNYALQNAPLTTEVVGDSFHKLGRNTSLFYQLFLIASPPFCSEAPEIFCG